MKMKSPSGTETGRRGGRDEDEVESGSNEEWTWGPSRDLPLES